MVDREFKLNGCTESFDEPHTFLDQAHGVLCCLRMAMQETDAGPINDQLLAEAVHGAETLVFLAAHGLRRMEKKREARANVG